MLLGIDRTLALPETRRTELLSHSLPETSAKIRSNRTFQIFSYLYSENTIVEIQFSENIIVETQF